MDATGEIDAYIVHGFPFDVHIYLFTDSLTPCQHLKSCIKSFGAEIVILPREIINSNFFIIIKHSYFSVIIFYRYQGAAYSKYRYIDS